MKRQLYFCMLVPAIFISLSVSQTGAIDVKDTKMLSQPAVSETNIAFVYAGDLWAADIDGRNVRRLTADEGIESNPMFSPNGELIAFSAQYDGNTDVFIIPVEGGVPRRLTWHPSADSVRGFTPDGSAVLFISNRAVFSNRYTQLFTVPVKGGYPEALKIPNAYKACYSPDGIQLAYNPLSERFRQWKNYRGGTASTIWLYKFADHSIDKVPQPEGRCNDIDPMWIGDKVYFLSDRQGEFNLFCFDIRSQNIQQLTDYTDFPIIDASSGAGKIIYEQAGHLHIYNLQSNRSRKLTIGVAADLLEVRPRYVKGSQYIRNSSISPSGARAVFEFRGEIVTAPAEKGDPRYLTQTTGVHERSPVWSPDGKNIAYFSDESGEYELHVRAQDGKGEIKKYEISQAGFYDRPVWSPDSKKICFTDNSWSIFWIDLDTKEVKKIGSEYLYGPLKTINGTWSADSKWIAYTLNTAAYIQKVYVYSVAQDKSYAITDGLSEVAEPVFDKSGKYIYFFASTDAGPVKNWFDMSIADMEMSQAIYLATLQKDVPSPLAKESDEEEGVEEKEEAESKEEKTKVEEIEFSIDFDGLDSRVISLPISAGNLSNLQVGDEGQVYYLQTPAGGDGASLHKYDLKNRKDEVIMSNVGSYQLSADSKKILYQSGSTFGIIASSGKSDPDKGKLNTDAMEVLIEPRTEWQQIFHEAWRINRDYFYATNMHGADWPAMRRKYEPFLEHVACRSDLNRVIQWMCSELAVGHHRVGGGDNLVRPESVPGGLLGADYEIANGRYRFKKIYGGLNWNPQLRSPLTEPGVNVQEGDYLLAVNGKELIYPDNIYRLFENSSGKIVEITVGSNIDNTDSRTVTVVPVANESALRNRDWVEGNIKKVDEATNGRVAYVYVPNTSTLGHTYFKRYFFPQAHKDAIIVDERFNGGGSVADYYIDILRRPFISNWSMRYGADLQTPTASIQGPKVMLIDETAGSGGDLLPWMFKELKLGKLIGKRTWGGLVGTLGFPILMDGGSVTAPNLAIWTEDGFIVENVGVPPDIEVEQWPDEVIAGHDPQLEKAIEVVLEELRENPPKKLVRPPFPIRIRK